MTDSQESEGNTPAPPIRVVRGNPTPEELAAALAVVRARAVAASPADSGAAPRAEWSDPARRVPQRVPHPGPKAWRTAFWPA